MEEQDTGVRGGELNNTEEVDKVQHQEKEETKAETEAREDQNHCEEQQPEGVTDDQKVEAKEEETGKDLPENSEVPEIDQPVIKEPVAEESVEVPETECVAQEEEKQVADVDGEEVKEVGKEESLEEPVNGVAEQQQEESEANHKENHINGTSTQEENNHIEAEEELTKEAEENCKNKNQEAEDAVDYQRKEFRNNHEDDSHHTISELRSKWDSFGKEQGCPTIDHIHCPSGMADTAKSSRFGGTAEKCTQCQKTVYAMERLEVAGRLMHKTCFRCCKCNSPLSVGRFSVGGGELYCMTHYKQAFREKGTYDVFTPDNPIKGKWQSKPAE